METPPKEKLTVTVELTGKALQLVINEKKRYKREERIGGKSLIINRLLSDMYDLKTKNK